MNCHPSVKPRQRLEYADMATVEAIAALLDRQVSREQADNGVDQETAISIVAGNKSDWRKTVRSLWLWLSTRTRLLWLGLKKD